MALNDESTGIGATMLMQPAGGIGYGGYPVYMGGNNNGGLFGNGGDSWLGILFLIALCNGGFGFGGFGGWGGMGMMNGMWGMGIDYLYPWLNNSEHISDGFRDQQLSSQVGNIQNAITSGFGDVQTSLCSGFAGVNATINGAQNAISQQMYSNELASLNRSFAEQTANTAGFTGVNSGIADLRYAEATEACATRTAAAQNTRDIIDAQTRGTQAILDKLCALELDGVKGQLAAAQRENVGLQNQLNMAVLRESQANQNALFAQGMNNEVDALYNRLKNCPVGTVPVFGNQPIFTCAQNGAGGCGCGCGA